MAADLDAETLLTTILEGIGQPFYAVDRDWRITLYNSDAARHFGRPAADMIGRRLWDIFPEDIHAERGRILFAAMAQRTTVKGETVSIVGPWVSYCMFPLGDGLAVTLRDVTDRRSAEHHRDTAEDALRKRTVELETVLETIPTAVWFTYDREGQTIVTNRRAGELLRLPPGVRASLAAPGHARPTYRFFRADKKVPPEELPIQRAMRGEEVKDEVLELRFDDGDCRIVLIRAAALRGSAGEIMGAVAAAADVTERHRYEDHLKLLLDELNHRVKNTLATVQSIAQQTLRGATDIEEARRLFEGRLMALARVHDVLIREDFQHASLRQVVDDAVTPYCTQDRDRVAIDGPDVSVPARHALALAMALHELCTNAAKYGALSRESGRIAVRWRIQDGDSRRLVLTWSEHGGPVVKPPTRRGFGSRLVERGLPRDLDGTARLDFDPEGVVCTIEMPLTSPPMPAP
jgi:PAS domain S-box-containing protein